MPFPVHREGFGVAEAALFAERFPVGLIFVAIVAVVIAATFEGR
jgi:hypothetical protein